MLPLSVCESCLIFSFGLFVSFKPLFCAFCSLCSFGKQLGGRRGCECITLEPSEMIVVSRNTASLSLRLCLLPKHLLFYPPLLSHRHPLISYLFFPSIFDVSVAFPSLLCCSSFFCLSFISIPFSTCVPIFFFTLPPLPVCALSLSSDSNSNELY